ncbi:alkaline phosphatase family protein [Granulicella sp. dw_53]|uniref:alkaline phosphatase family protein n=1 Tax=Granulicella sp. dw_53 TaxID=2719792 RepID=UPI001BD205FC|nr:alkaline phosphatase family protein [Granulicella sp. dw_53]
MRRIDRSHLASQRHRIVLALALMCLAQRSYAQNSSSERQVIVISIDGLTPVEYEELAAHHLQIPNLEAMRAGGCASPGVLVTLPASTYPNHTAMITGVPPALHGVISNTPIDPFNLENGGWYYYADKIKVPTLWQVMRRAGVKTAAVSWPVTVGAEIDYLLPEYRPVRTEEDAALMRALSTPGLFHEAEVMGKDSGPAMGDAWRTEAVIDILRTRKPQMMFLHLSGLDEAQHKYGPHSPESHAELEVLDGDIGKIRRSVETSGKAGNTAWIIVSDHGFLAVSKVMNPMVALREAGLITTDANGKVTAWKVYPRNHTGSLFLEAKDKGDAQSIAKATAVMQELAKDPENGIAKLDSVEDLKGLGADPDAFLAAEAAPGFGFGNGISGPLRTSSAQKGAHGYSPSLAEMHASFILFGAGVQPCKSLPGVRIMDVGPTAAALLGVTMPNTQGVAVDHVAGR